MERSSEKRGPKAICGKYCFACEFLLFFFFFFFLIRIGFTLMILFLRRDFSRKTNLSAYLAFDADDRFGHLNIRFVLSSCCLHVCMNKRISVLSWKRNRLLIFKVEKV